MATEKPGRLKVISTGALAGAVAALLMTMVLLVVRHQLGVATPSELVGDRMAPKLSVDTFIRLLTLFDGFNNLKKFGFGSVIGGQLLVGLLGGAGYALLVNRADSRESRFPLKVTNKSGLRFVVFLVTALWLSSLILLWPVLGTHYYGLPPGTATLVTALSLLTAYGLYGLSLIIGYRLIVSPAAAPGSRKLEFQGRRALLLGGAGALIAIAVDKIWKRLFDTATFSYDGTQYLGSDVQFLTPNERFYVVTKNIIDPRVNPELWRLEIGGMVERPHSYSFQELTALPAIDQETTLMCISNQVGGGLMSNARWHGVPLRNFIQQAGPKSGITKIVLRAVDGYDDTIPLAKAMEPTTLVVYEMNGSQLPFLHGYPMRVVVPGLFGEKSVKWVTRIECVAHDVKGFYEKQGWGPDFNIPTHSRFDGPDLSGPISLGSAVHLKGVAFGGDRGVSKVEVSTDDGNEWREAEITMPGTRLTWALWRYDWQPPSEGDYKLVVRATDGNGNLQIKEERWTVPHGATGYHKVTVRLVR